LSDGKTALDLATARGNPDAVRLLIHRGAAAADGSVERADYAGRFAQDIAGEPVKREDTYGLPQAWINEFVGVAHSNYDRVKQMHRMCPSLLMTRATWDELAVEAGAHVGNTAITEYLVDAGSPVSTCTAVMLGMTGLVRKMVQGDPNRVRERGAHNFALLCYTAFGPERLEIAEFLLDAGARIDPGVPGISALHVAAGRGHIDLARLFLERGAEVNILTRSRGGITPLAVAVRSKQGKMEAFLRERGGKVEH